MSVESKNVRELNALSDELMALAPTWGSPLRPQDEQRLDEIVDPLSEEDKQRLYVAFALRYMPGYAAKLLRQALAA